MAKEKKSNNAQNIIPNSERTPQERQEIARSGGIASGEARRERKRLRELAEIIANETISTTMPDGSKRSTTFSEALIIGQYREAMKGKTEAAKFLATLLGDFVEKKEETLKAEVKTEDSDFDLLTDDEKDEIVRKIQDAKHARYMEQRYGKTADTNDNE